MPQFDISNFSSQIFWLLICFFSMLLIMSKFILPKISNIIDEREKRINDNLDKAAKIKEQAEEIFIKYQKSLDDATYKANKSLEKTQKELEAIIKNKQNELLHELNNKIAEGEEAIHKSKQHTLSKVKGMSEILALDIINKINIKNITEKDIKDIMNTSEE